MSYEDETDARLCGREAAADAAPDADAGAAPEGALSPAQALLASVSHRETPDLIVACAIYNQLCAMGATLWRINLRLDHIEARGIAEGRAAPATDAAPEQARVVPVTPAARRGKR